MLFLAAVFFGCSTKRNTRISRTYQNFTSHYNIYFNARQSLKSGLQRIDNTIQDDFTHTLPVYKTSVPEAGKIAVSEMDLAILKCSKLIALHSITRSPKRKSNTSERYKKFASKGEYNRWVDDSYLLMGKANYFNHNYHEAQENFNYLINKFPDNSNRYNGWLWLARTYTESGQNDKALEIFRLLEQDKGFPRKLKKDLNVAEANYHVAYNQSPEAINSLQNAMKTHFPRKQQLRYHYILAQLFSATDQPQMAVLEYRKVLKMKPPSQMEFNARISTLELSDPDDVKTASQIEKLLNDKDNLEFLDRIYFAKGQIALRNNHKPEALNDFMLSVKSSSSNNYQRALSSLSAAKILFEENNYALSSCYYDSAMAVIDNGYPDYQEIKTRSESLKRLTVNLNTISREDSLQRLASMPETQRNQLIKQIIEKLQEKERQDANQNVTAASDQNYFRTQQYRPQIRIDDNQNQWYFYNPTTAGIGKSEFQRLWGKRKLEDNWRRKNKISVNPDEMDQLVQEINQTKTQEKKKADPKTAEYYLQDLPMSDTLRKISTEKIKAAYYNAGKIYQADFNDFPKAIKSFEELNRRFPGNVYELPSWYELYQINERMGNHQQSAIYKARIVKAYPASNYAMSILNPNYSLEYKNRNEEIEKKYSEALQYYQAGDFANAGKMASETLLMNPDTSILSKAKFIEIVCADTTQTKNALAVALDSYIAQFPKASTIVLAKQIRNLLKTKALSDYSQLIKNGYLNEEKTAIVETKKVLPVPSGLMTKESKPVTSEPSGKAVPVEAPKINPVSPLEGYQGIYKKDVSGENIYAFIFQTEGADTTLLKSYFRVFCKEDPANSRLNVSIKPMDDFRSILMITGFTNLSSGFIWFKKLTDVGVLPIALKNISYRHFIITPSNLEILMKEKNLTTYLDFFKLINQP